jgi:hypothetical protein
MKSSTARVSVDGPNGRQRLFDVVIQSQPLKHSVKVGSRLTTEQKHREPGTFTRDLKCVLADSSEIIKRIQCNPSPSRRAFARRLAELRTVGAAVSPLEL